MQFPASAGPQAYFTTNGVLFCSRNSFCCIIGIGFLLNHTPSKGFCHMQKPRCNLHRGFLAERMRLERTMPCGTPHFQCGSLPLEYLSISNSVLLFCTRRPECFITISKLKAKIKPFFKKFFQPPSNRKTCRNVGKVKGT